MELALPFKKDTINFDAPFPPENLAIARRNPLPDAQDRKILTERALDNPIGQTPLHESNLTGRKAAIIFQSGKMLEAATTLPLIIERLGRAGIDEQAITIVLACAERVLTADDLVEELGIKLASSCRCLFSNSFGPDHQFLGFSTLGTPIFINKAIAEADFTIAVSAVQPHPWYGYSGGYEAVVPGAAAIETIITHRSICFSYNSTYGYLGNNPARLDLENMGITAGLDYTVNYVLLPHGEAAAAFAGDPLRSHRAAVNYGDRMIWGAELGKTADIAIASPGHEWHGDRPFDPRAIDFAAPGVKQHGTIIFLADRGQIQPEKELWQREIAELPTAELARFSAKRDLQGNPRDISQKVLYAQDVYLARRPFFYRNVILVGSELSENELSMLSAEQVETVDEAIELAIERHGEDASVALIPDALTTLALPEFH